MALLINWKFKGLTLEGAYVRIVSPMIGPSKDRISFGVHYHVDPAEEVLHAETREAPYSLQGGNPFEQAYDFLLAQEEFAGAESV